jgi:hypothetical protein
LIIYDHAPTRINLRRTPEEGESTETIRQALPSIEIVLMTATPDEEGGCRRQGRG